MRISIAKYVSATSSAAAIQARCDAGTSTVRVEQHRVRALDGVDELREEVRRDRVRERHAEFCALLAHVVVKFEIAGVALLLVRAPQPLGARVVDIGELLQKFGAGHVESLVGALYVSRILGGCSQGKYQYRCSHGDAKSSPGRAGAPLGARARPRPPRREQSRARELDR